jgi:hypothetical protein
VWIFTQSGFVSAVRHWSQPDTLVVRSRDRDSLEDLAELLEVPIEKSPTNDYPYRVHVEEKKFTEWLALSVATLDYTNFKGRVHDMRGDDYADALMEVWQTMHQVEDDEARIRG